MTTYARKPKLFGIGDIHGHYKELIALQFKLYKEAGFDPDLDVCVFVGDYVDGGPETKKVLDTLIDWSKRYPHWVFLMGNHEQMMLDALKVKLNNPNIWYHWWNQGGRATAQSYIPDELEDTMDRLLYTPEDNIPAEHTKWMAERPLIFQTDKHIFVHAGLRPGVSIDEQSSEDLLWIREPFIRTTYDFGKVVVFGHTPFQKPYKKVNKIGIDLMFHDFGHLCAVDLTNDKPVFYKIKADAGIRKNT